MPQLICEYSLASFLADYCNQRLAAFIIAHLGGSSDVQQIAVAEHFLPLNNPLPRLSQGRFHSPPRRALDHLYRCAEQASYSPAVQTFSRAFANRRPALLADYSVANN